VKLSLNGFPLLPLTLVILITATDIWLQRVSLWSLFVLPVFIAMWVYGRRTGAIVCATCVAAVFCVDLHVRTSPLELAQVVQLASRISAILLVAWLVGRLRLKEVERTFLVRR
jgi:hypothetical protein